MKLTWDIIKNYMYKRYGQQSGTMIIHAGALGWILSSLAQITAVIFNDKIPKEQKKFLIPQEIADGIVNVFSYYLITKTIKDIGGKLVKTGKWSNKAIRDFVKDKAKMGDIKTDLEEQFKGNETFHNVVYNPFKNGVDMITTTIGSVLSCNFITPYLRNIVGAKEQQKALAQDKARNAAISPYTPVLPSQNRVSMDAYRAKITQSSGAMKV